MNDALKRADNLVEAERCMFQARVLITRMLDVYTEQGEERLRDETNALLELMDMHHVDVIACSGITMANDAERAA